MCVCVCERERESERERERERERVSVCVKVCERGRQVFRLASHCRPEHSTQDALCIVSLKELKAALHRNAISSRRDFLQS